MSDPAASFEIPAEAVRVIAQAMIKLSASDGIDEQEVAMIRQFLAAHAVHEGPAPKLAALEAERLDYDEVRKALPTLVLRELFLKSNLLLACADGAVSDEEQALIAEYAREVGVSEERLQALEVRIKSLLVHRHATHFTRAEAESLGRDLRLSPEVIEQVLAGR